MNHVFYSVFYSETSSRMTLLIFRFVFYKNGHVSSIIKCGNGLYYSHFVPIKSVLIVFNFFIAYITSGNIINIHNCCIFNHVYYKYFKT